MSAENLWGDIPIETEIKLPVTILKEQAAILGEKTNRVLEAKVVPAKMPFKDRVSYVLNIVAPSLDNYEYFVLRIIHAAVFVYPVTLIYYETGESEVRTTCKDEEEFINGLKQVLSSPAIHKVIAALISQSKAAP